MDAAGLMRFAVARPEGFQTGRVRLQFRYLICKVILQIAGFLLSGLAQQYSLEKQVDQHLGGVALLHGSEAQFRRALHDQRVVEDREGLKRCVSRLTPSDARFTAGRVERGEQGKRSRAFAERIQAASITISPCDSGQVNAP